MNLPLKTNASHNREQAMRLFEAGYTPQEIAANFPLVFTVSSDGLLGQKYNKILADGRKETVISVSSAAVEKLIRSRLGSTID